MRFVAYAEVAIFARVLLGALLLRNSLLAPLFYAHFCRLRFYMSSFTREAFSHVGRKMDEATTHQACPPVVRKAYVMGTDVVSCPSAPSTPLQPSSRCSSAVGLRTLITRAPRQISRYASTVLSVQGQGAPAAGAAPAAANGGAAPAAGRR